MPVPIFDIIVPDIAVLHVKLDIVFHRFDTAAVQLFGQNDAFSASVGHDRKILVVQPKAFRYIGQNINHSRNMILFSILPDKINPPCNAVIGPAQIFITTVQGSQILL